jgi:endonuclease YncB( thermonuclease family)
MTGFNKSSIINLQFSFPSRFTLLLFTIFFVTLETPAAQTWHTVRWVNDGDTIVLNSGQRVRYIGINTPEIDHEDQKAQPYGYQARSYNKMLVESRKVRLEYDVQRQDRYGRCLAYVFLQDRTFVNARLLEDGLAYYLYWKPNSKYGEILLKAQQDAMTSRKGLWRNWSEKAQVYVGNRNSKRFHVSGCKFAEKINPRNRVRFSSKWTAFYRGYAPSKKCIEEFWSYRTKK